MDKSDTEMILDRIVSIDEALSDYKVAARRDYDQSAGTMREKLQAARHDAEAAAQNISVTVPTDKEEDPTAAKALQDRCAAHFKTAKDKLLADFIDVITKES